MKEVSLKEILEAAVVRSREQARTWCKKVDFDVKADSIDIKADPALLVSALFEIMENSIIFLETQGRRDNRKSRYIRNGNGHNHFR